MKKMGYPRISRKTRQDVFIRAKGCCEYCKCQAAFSPQPFSVEHILPLVSGGENALDNLALACQGCNNYKFTNTVTLDPVSGKLAPLFHPRNQQWSDHFRWNADCTQIIGLTPSGRATTLRLKLNRPGLVNLRAVLYALGEHPPS